MQRRQFVIRQIPASRFSIQDRRHAPDAVCAFGELLLAQRCQPLCSSGIVRCRLCLRDRLNGSEQLTHHHRPRHRRIGVC